MPNTYPTPKPPETLMAVFPQSSRREDERVLTYASSSEQPDPDYPNQHCLILPIYGEITSIVQSPNPAATRQWLANQRGLYQERWDAGIRQPFGSKTATTEPRATGRYIVGIATDIQNIPKTVHGLSRQAGGARSTPFIPDNILYSLHTHYAGQAGPVPQFVIGIHAATPTGPEAKEPITVRYTQFSDIGHLATLPGLQYQGETQLKPYVSRNHSLLIATNELNGIFGGALPIEAAELVRDRPPELPNAPLQFSLQIKDTRIGRDDTAKPIFAPNRDYLFDMLSIHYALGRAEPDLSNLPPYSSPDQALSARVHRSSIRRAVILQLGSRGLLSCSNQPAQNTDTYINAGDEGAKTLDTRNLGD